jgi:hypothetical protein
MKSSSLYAVIATLTLSACATVPTAPGAGLPLAAFNSGGGVQYVEEIHTAIEAEPEVVCVRELRTGSRLPHTVCRTRVQIANEQRQARQFFAALTHRYPIF